MIAAETAGMARNPYYDGPVSDHFDGLRFFVPGAPNPDKTAAELWRFWRTASTPWPAEVATAPPARPERRVEGARLRVTSIGHASHLIQTAGINVLVDPVWSQRASPFTFLGPRRHAPPGVAFDQLPPIDAVLVTHNHYDHLDLATIGRLHAVGRCRVIVPLGNDAILRRHDPNLRVEAYDWDDRVELAPGVAVTLLPCLHWSARRRDDRRMALWAAFLIETANGSIYHIGDTAFGDGAPFRDVRERFGRPRLAIIPVGAYEPRWFMRNQHVDPAEAVRIFELCEAHHALGHHWGCFKLTTEPHDEPPRRLRAELATRGIEPVRFRTQLTGESFDVPEV